MILSKEDEFYRVLDINSEMLVSKIDNMKELMISRFDSLENRVSKLETTKKDSFLTKKQKEIIKYVVIVLLTTCISYFSPNFKDINRDKQIVQTEQQTE